MRALSASSLSGEKRLKSGAMNAGQAQAMRNMTASHSANAHTHHQRPGALHEQQRREEQRAAEHHREREALGRDR